MNILFYSLLIFGFSYLILKLIANVSSKRLSCFVRFFIFLFSGKFQSNASRVVSAIYQFCLFQEKIQNMKITHFNLHFFQKHFFKNVMRLVSAIYVVRATKGYKSYFLISFEAKRTDTLNLLQHASEK